MISQYDQNGDAWDFPGGMPDPQVCAFRNDQDPAVHCTSTVQDTFTANFNSFFDADIYGSDKWTFVAYDEDLTDFERIEGVYADPISVAYIKAGGFVHNGDYMTELIVDITPVQ